MILAGDQNVPRVVGDPRAAKASKPSALRAPSIQQGDPGLFEGDARPDRFAKLPLSDEEIAEYSRIKCCVCGGYVLPEEVAEHSKLCVLEPVANLQLQLDKWFIASANLTRDEQRQLVELRRTEELILLEDLEARLADRMPQLWWMGGRFGYLISSRWLREWRSFVGLGRPMGLTRDRPPSPINNLALFDLGGTLRAGLEEGLQRDYYVVDQPIWDMFVQVYGGGPAILRYSPQGTAPIASDQEAVFEGEWRDMRPDTGHGRVFDASTGFGFDGELQGGFLWNCVGKGLLQSGSHFEGVVVDGLPDGKGREVCPDGTVLEGDFAQGCLHGSGRVTDPHGGVEEGEWEYGELLGI